MRQREMILLSPIVLKKRRRNPAESYTELYYGLNALTKDWKF